jgi:hypothetical protein
MTNDQTPSRPVRCRRFVARALLVALVLPAAGCNLLADEFTWLNRRAPSTVAAPDAPWSLEAIRP